MRRLPFKNFSLFRVIAPIACAISALAVCGCHDGPMYALKEANPYYSLYHWPASEKLGATDHVRSEELSNLVDVIDGMSESEQRVWMTHLDQLMANDKSAHMRSLAVQAAANASVPEGIGILRQGLEDDVTKVRMVAAASLERRSDEEATRLLVETVNSETNKDVRLAAIKSLGNHRGTTVNDALKLALKEPDLAYRHQSIASLRKITGQDAGDNAEAWIAMLEHGPSEGQEESDESWTSRLKSFF